MTRRCSHCSHNGHNSRTCPSRGGVKLFGVRLTDGSMKKSASMGNLSSHHYCSSSSAAASPNPSSPLRDSTPVAEGYVSDDPAHASCSSNCRIERKKGNPWTEEEHRLFLMGLKKLGKGDWRGIARNFVMSRTPTQVASHAQKYFIRQSNATRRKRRSSLFDMVPDMASDPPPVAEEQFLLPSSKPEDTKNLSHLAPVSLSLDREYEPMEVTLKETCTEPAENVSSSDFPPVIPAFFPTYLPVPFPFWPPDLVAAGEEKEVETSQHEVIKPIPVLPKDPVNVDDLGGMSQLSLREDVGGPMKPSPLSLKLIGAPSRPSAFHANAPVNESDLGNAIHAV